MKRKPSLKVFFDSDVVISSLLSTQGAAYLLLENKENVPYSCYLSNVSREEIITVSKRLELFLESVLIHLDKYFLETRLTKSEVKEFLSFVKDPNDAHIIAATKKAECPFMVTYNKKDFLITEIKSLLDIIIMSPGEFLQFTRSLKIFK